MVLAKYVMEQPIITSSLKVTSFKTTRGQRNWLDALRRVLCTENRSQTIKKLVDLFFEHLEPQTGFEELERSIAWHLFKDTKYTPTDLGLIIKDLNYDAGCLHSSVMITIKFKPEQLTGLRNLHRMGLVLSLSEAIRFIFGFYIVLLTRLITTEVPASV